MFQAGFSPTADKFFGSNLPSGKNPSAKHIPRISAQELIERDLPDLIVERVVLEYLQRTRFTREVQIVNVRKPGNLTKALVGEDVGTIIYHGA